MLLAVIYLTSYFEAAITDYSPFPSLISIIVGKSRLGLMSGGLIEKTGEGKIILGLEGERIVNHYSFYSWRGFNTPPLWGVHKGIKPESDTL
jgi:hypothetical protein